MAIICYSWITLKNDDKNYFASIFKWLRRENKAFQGQDSDMKIFPHHLLYHILKPKSQEKDFGGATVIEGPKNTVVLQW